MKPALQTSSQDRLFSEAIDRTVPFAFDKRVASVFDDMITRSVPLYALVQDLSAQIAARFATPGSALCDLGCSTGTTLVAVTNFLTSRQVQLIGVDNSGAMLDACRKKLAEHGVVGVQLIEADLAQIALPPCSAILCNYTLQFVPPEQRVAILKRIHAALNPGGALVLTEKICHAEPRLHELVVELHHKLKSINGYTELEIAQKRDALENVLIPLTLAENLSNLREAGFVQTEVVLGLYNFVTLVAVKDRKGTVSESTQIRG